jgi:hypothetical protein
MNRFLYLIPLLLVISCTHVAKMKDRSVVVKHTPGKSATQVAEKPIVRYSDQLLEAFLDSIGRLTTQTLADKTAFGADSVFKSPVQLDTVISPKDFEILKHAARKGVMTVKTARRIFKNDHISYDCNTKSVILTYKLGLIPVVYTPFSTDKDGFDEFALCIGEPGHCFAAALYFFKGNRIIGMHEGYNRFADELAYYKDNDGKPLIYYGKAFDSGTGVGWNNLFFYKYYGNKLIPVLNELQFANLLQPTPWGGSRSRWLEASVLKTNPLTIKMVYNQHFFKSTDSTGYDDGPDFINDSTIIRYKWDERSKTIQGQYAASKISKAQILSYYLFDNEYLFINSHYELLKRLLRDSVQRKWELSYLNAVKNHRLP